MLGCVYHNSVGRLKRLFPLFSSCVLSVLMSYTVTVFAAPALVDITSQVMITTSGFRVNHQNGAVAQAVIITNTGSKPIIGVLHLAVSNLASGVNVSATKDGAVFVDQYGDSVLRLNKGAEITLLPNEKFTTSLQFSNTNNRPIKYQMSLFRESGT